LSSVANLDTEKKKRLFLELSKDRDFIYSLPKHKMEKVIQSVRKVKERKYKRRNLPKYVVPAYKSMNLEEVNRFFSAFHPCEWRYKVLFMTQAFLGLRIGEVVKITIKDIDFQNKQIKIKTEKQGPFEVQDSMFLHDRLQALLLDYIQEYEREIAEHDGFLFYTSNARCRFKHVSADRARNVFRKICNRAGLTETYGEREPYSDLKNWKPGKLYKYTTHSLRYAFAQYLRRKNVPEEIRQHLMRHRDRSSLQIYDAPGKQEVDSELRRVFSLNQ